MLVSIPRVRALQWSSIWLVAMMCAGICLFPSTAASAQRYACEDDLLEVMFTTESQVRLRGGTLVDLQTKAVDALPTVLGGLDWYEWAPISAVPEVRIDEMHAEAVARSRRSVYNMNNVYRLRIPKDQDVWALSEALEALPGISHARPVPLPMPPPLPPDYEPNQGYLLAASAYPTGIDAIYANGQPGGAGLGVTVCDLEYSWNYTHADIAQAAGSQINSNVSDPFSDNNHGTAVIGILAADANAWGVTGICIDATLLTCGTYYGTPSPSWNVSGALLLAASQLNPGDIILVEQQWDYDGAGGYIPIEWWTNYSPSSQTFNTVYAAIDQIISQGIVVVEAAGNGGVNMDALWWYGDNGATIVGAGGAYIGGTYPEGNMQRLSFSSYGYQVNLHGWGENVVTTGYGDYYNTGGADYYYTSIFAGTSSASPIVAGAYACFMGYWLSNVSSTPPSPVNLRTMVMNTGSPQLTPPIGNIGPRPDLYAAINSIVPPCSCPHQLDFDTDGQPTSVDLNRLINIIFFNATDTQDPQCPGFRSDFNCDGVPNSVDLNNFILRLFFNGPLPCDPCACSPYPTNCP